MRLRRLVDCLTQGCVIVRAMSSRIRVGSGHEAGSLLHPHGDRPGHGQETTSDQAADGREHRSEGSLEFLDVLVVHQKHIRHCGAGFVLAEFE